MRKSLAQLLFITILVLSTGMAEYAWAARCTNGSDIDCNPEGSTFNAFATFVDPDPPLGYIQCAGFINTQSDDVAWNWENNCIPFKNGPLFLRVYNDTNGALLAGARLFNPIQDCWNGGTGLSYRTDGYEEEGFLDNPALQCGSGVTLAWHTSDRDFCGCNRPGGSGNCNDIYAANERNDKILYVGANSSSHNYEAAWGPPGGKGTCSLNNEIVRLRIGIYSPAPDTDGDGHDDTRDNCPDDPNPDQADQDSDGVGDICDNCPEDENDNQSDIDQDTIGDECDCAPEDPNEPGEDERCPKCGGTPAEVAGKNGENTVPSGIFLVFLLIFPFLLIQFRQLCHKA